MKDNTINILKDFIKVLINEIPYKDCNGVEYHYGNNCFLTFTEGLDNFDISKVYPGAKTKMSSLKNAYFNKESLDRAKYRMMDNIGKSYSISLQNNDKNYTTQDHCMVSMVIFKEKKNHYDITVFYRTTEICRKFLFDLVFIRDVILPYLGIKDYRLNFMFTRLTLSYIFLHTIFLLTSAFYPEGYTQQGHKFWRGYLRYMDKMLSIKERGSMLKSHWRHFQNFKGTRTCNQVYRILRGNYDEGTD